MNGDDNHTRIIILGATHILPKSEHCGVMRTKSPAQTRANNHKHTQHSKSLTRTIQHIYVVLVN